MLCETERLQRKFYLCYTIYNRNDPEVLVCSLKQNFAARNKITARSRITGAIW